MKTLDEVIIAFELSCGKKDCGQCPYDEDCLDHHVCECYERMNDALYYLKEYRSDMQIYAENQKHWEDELAQKIKDFGDAKDRYIARLKELDIGTLNEPLTWDELKAMEGKPVWIEWISGTWKGLRKLVISHGCDDLMMVFTALDVAGVSYDGHLRQMNLGKTWQAYRKELE